ncbi:MAG: DUF885 domain-containing protein [Rhizomicrobium sp.]|jgi:uncharacterized protein (DUF885 family)
MRWVFRGLAFLVVVALAGAGFVYVKAIGVPFTFNEMLNRQAVAFVWDRPQILTSLGLLDGTSIDNWSGTLDAYSLQARDKDYALEDSDEAAIKKWDKSSLGKQEQLSYDIAVWDYDRELSGRKYPWAGANGQAYPVNQAFGVQKELPNFLLSQHAITNARLARHYVDRLRAMAEVLDAVNADVARQAKLGVVPPDFVIDDSVDQMKTLIAAAPDKNVLVTNLSSKMAKLGDLSRDEKAALMDDATAAVRDNVYPAYRRLIARMRDIRKSATHDAGLWHLKGGDAYYADQLKFLTSTDMTPAEIHDYGLSEVARITAEADKELRSVGLVDGTVGARLDGLMKDPRFLYSNDDKGRAAMLARYKVLLAHVKTLLPQYFSYIPPQPLDVRRVPPYAEKGSAGAYYEQPSLGGSRPGVFFANLRNVGETPQWAMPTLAYHEGIPGHHLQLSTAQSIEGLPLLRRFNFLPAYGEGWALYAEHLASDMGLYKNDPYGDLGRLQAELFRAVRLVVDTGMHAQHWSREQAIQYMQSTTGMANSDVTAEVERYVVWPGQACAYKVGMKMILGLREQAKAELGPKFNIKEFHAVVLENGAMPLWLLQKNVDSWIAEKEGLVSKQ